MSKEIEERFWAKVQKGENCWLWMAGRSKNGYGNFAVSGKWYGAHCYAWILEHGPIEMGMCILHHCDNRQCVRPSHLFLGTKAKNQADMAAKGRAARGEKQWMSKLTASEVLKIRALSQRGLTQQQIADEFGVSRGNISFVINRVTWVHI